MFYFYLKKWFSGQSTCCRSRMEYHINLGLLLILHVTEFCYLFCRPLYFAIYFSGHWILLFHQKSMKPKQWKRQKYQGCVTLYLSGHIKVFEFNLIFKGKGMGIYVIQANYIHPNFANSPPSLSKELTFIISVIFNIWYCCKCIFFFVFKKIRFLKLVIR